MDEVQISLRSNITRRKANITEKDDCFRNRLFLGGEGGIRSGGFAAYHAGALKTCHRHVFSADAAVPVRIAN